MNRHVIYTAVVGNYDKILQPLVVDNSFDYILFSNGIKEDKVGVWQIRKIDYYNEDQIKIARWVKTHPERLLPGYDFSVWMDANVQIATDFAYRRSKELFASNIIISSIFHPERNCIYEEMFAVFVYRYETLKTILKWYKVLKKNNYPSKNGLNETNVIFRNHTKPQTKKLDDLWWNCIKQYSRRDQLSFNYVLWELGYFCELFLPPQQSTRNSRHFNYISHVNDQTKYCIRKSDFSWIQYYCMLFPKEKDKIKAVFFNIIRKRFPALRAFFYGTRYRIIIYWRKFFYQKKGL